MPTDDFHLPPSYSGTATPAHRGSDASATSTDLSPADVAAAAAAVAAAHTHSALPPPPLFDPTHEALPEYTPKDAERERRDTLMARHWAAAAERDAALAALWAEDARDRRERRQARRDSAASTGGAMGVLERWNRWSAKFYMPGLARWPAAGGKQV